MEHSSFGRLASVLLAPERTFRSIAARPTVVVVLLVSILVGLGLQLAIVPKVDYEAATRQQLERREGQISEEQMERAVGIAEKTKWIAPVAGTLIIAPLVMVIMAALVMVTLRLMGSELSFKASLSTCLYGLVPTVVKVLLMFPVVLGAGEIDPQAAQEGTLLASNLAWLAPADASPILVGALSSVDVFSAWSIFLLVVGLAIVGRVGKGAAATTVALVWGLGIAIKLGLLALFM